MSEAIRGKELMERASQFLAGGTMHHTTHGSLPRELQPVVAWGQGSKFWDVDGKEYIDYVMGSGPLVLGHAHPEVVEAVEAQAGIGSQYYNLSEPMIDLAETLVEAVPCAERVKFTGSGNEATMMALRLARAVTGKHKIMKMEGAYHGTHDYTAWGGTHKEPFEYPYPPRDSRGIPDELAGLVLAAPFNDLETTSRLIEENKDELAAVIVEPVQRNIPPKVEFLEGLREVTSRCGVILIFDEVVTGFRLAWGGGQEYYGVTPDLATLGKIMGGGYPIGAIVGREELFDPFTPEAAARGEVAMYGGTFSGNPVSMAAGRAALNVLRRQGQYERLALMGKRLGDGLKELSQMLEVPMFVCQEESIVDVMFTDKEVVGYRDTWSVDAEKAYRFKTGMIRRRVWTVPGGPKMYVSLVHSEEDIDRTLAVAEESLRDLRS